MNGNIQIGSSELQLQTGPASVRRWRTPNGFATRIEMKDEHTSYTLDWLASDEQIRQIDSLIVLAWHSGCHYNEQIHLRQAVELLDKAPDEMAKLREFKARAGHLGSRLVDRLDDFEERFTSEWGRPIDVLGIEIVDPRDRAELGDLARSWTDSNLAKLLAADVDEDEQDDNAENHA